MSVDVVIPEVGEAGMSVTFVGWLKQEGDYVTAGEPIFQIDTEKALFDVEAFADGRLVDLRVQAGDLIEPQQVVARLVSGGEEAAAEVPAEGEKRPDADVASNPSSDGTLSAKPPEVGGPEAGQPRGGPGVEPARISPRARRYAREHGVDPEGLGGSGPDGLVTQEDVERALSRRDEESAVESAPSDNRADRVRRAVAERTVSAWRAIPHISLALDADVTDGLGSSRLFAHLCRSLARALGEHPECNLEWSEGSLARRESIDLGVLVDTPTGLLLTAVRKVQELSRDELELAIAAASERARGGRLSADDFGARSLTVSNLGMFSVDRFIGVIAQPDVLLVTVGRMSTDPRWNEGAWEPRKMLPVVVSADHRALDGADVARFLTTLEKQLGSND